MTPDDPRHGTTRGYAMGCRHDCCREARNTYERNRRKRKAILGIDLAIDATGTRRRIHALMALGHPSRDIGARCGWTSGEAVLEIARRNWVQRKTAQTIARVYDELSMTVGPSDKTRMRAARNGWLPPLAWDNIDNQPDPVTATRGSDNAIDEAVVERFMNGDTNIHKQATTAERRAIVARWRAAGRSVNELGRITGWKPERYYQEDAA